MASETGLQGGAERLLSRRMTDEKFFALILALVGLCGGFLVMGVLGRIVGGDAEVYLRFSGFAVGGLAAVYLWRRAV